MKKRNILNTVLAMVLLVGLSGCGEDSSSYSPTKRNSSKDTPNKLYFKAIDHDSFSITLEKNNKEYYHVGMTIRDNEGSQLNYTGLNVRGKAILSCRNSFSASDLNVYDCILKYIVVEGYFTPDDREIKLFLNKDKRYSIYLKEFKMGEKDKETLIQTIPSEY